MPGGDLGPHEKWNGGSPKKQASTGPGREIRKGEVPWKKNWGGRREAPSPTQKEKKGDDLWGNANGGGQKCG